MSLSKKLTCKATLRLVFYMSEAPFPPMTPYSLPPLTHCIRKYSILSGIDREGGGELSREKVRGAVVHKAGRKYQLDCVCISSF
jgi:hypothetical protein